MVITLCQQNIAWANPEANRRAAEQQIAAAQEGSLVVLPETFTTGFGGAMAEQAEEPEGPTLQWARAAAQRYGKAIVATWIVREGECCYNRLHWLLPDGSGGHYDKAHLFRGGEAEQLCRGTQRPLFTYQGWRIRPAVCYDLRFPTFLRNTRSLDYDLLLICANWPQGRREAWTTLLKARAIENLCYVAGCNRTGADAAGTEYGGNSLILDYKGKPLTTNAPDEPTLCATLDKEALASFRQRWPFNADFD